MTSSSPSSGQLSRHWPLAASGFALFVMAHAHAITAPLALPLLLAGFGVAAWRGQVNFDRPFDLVDIALLTLGAVWIVCSATAIDPERALALSVPVAIALFSAAVLRRVDEEARSAELILLALALMGGWLSARAIWTAVMGTDSVETAVQAINSPWLVVPNDLAWVACLWPGWSAHWGRAAGGRLGLLLLWLLLLGGLIVLQSRLGLLLLGVATATELAGRVPLRTRWTVIVMACIGLALLMPWLFDKGLAGIQARLQLWQSAWALFLEHPWLGVGPHGFVHAYADVVSVDRLVDPRLTPWPHSLPLELLAEGGLLMAMAFLLLLLAVRDAFHGWHRGSMLITLLILCAVEASTLRLWFWVLVVVFLLPSGTRSPSTER